MFGMMRRYDADCSHDAPQQDQTTKRSHFSEEQVIGNLNQHEADVLVTDLPQARRQRRQQLQMKSEVRRGWVKRLKTLEHENTHLKRLLADSLSRVDCCCGRVIMISGHAVSGAGA